MDTMHDPTQDYMIMLILLMFNCKQNCSYYLNLIRYDFIPSLNSTDHVKIDQLSVNKVEFFINAINFV